MKNLKLFVQKMWQTGLYLGFIALLFTNCTEDVTLEKVQPDMQQKAFHMLPVYQVGDTYIYKGMVNNDSIEIIVPAFWNGSFIVYAHGYVDPILPIALPDDRIEGTTIKQMLLSQGFGYAATSYSENGFAVKEGVQDVLFLGNMLKAHFKPDKLFIGGVSEGGLVALKTLEKYGNTFNAGLISCGPIGNFNRQLQYFGDFHVLFNYIYAEELSSIPPLFGGPIDIGSPAFVAPDVMEAWSAAYLDLPLQWVISQNPMKLPLLMNIAKIPVDGVPADMLPFLARDILRFNIMATNDMIERLHGIPFDNTSKIYTGDFPFDYVHLNTHVMRIAGDKQAMQRMKNLFETNGSPLVPVVFLHTLGDHVTPVWHVNAYFSKVDPSRIGQDIIFIPVDRFGHCNYMLPEVVAGIAAMVSLAQ